MLLALACLIAQGSAVWTGLCALRLTAGQGPFRSVWITVVISWVGCLAAIIMMVDPAGPRLQFGLDSMLTIGEGFGLALLHLAIIRHRGSNI